MAFFKITLSILVIMSISACGVKGPLLEIQKAEIF
jgi:predicted small lipoprotein YifL